MTLRCVVTYCHPGFEQECAAELQEQAAAAGVADWVAAGLCRDAIFNLKLPMKKRFEELRRSRALIEARLADVEHSLCFKHLYHDREEVTGYLRRERKRAGS